MELDDDVELAFSEVLDEAAAGLSDDELELDDSDDEELLDSPFFAAASDELLLVELFAASRLSLR